MFSCCGQKTLICTDFANKKGIVKIVKDLYQVLKFYLIGLTEIIRIKQQTFGSMIFFLLEQMTARNMSQDNDLRELWLTIRLLSLSHTLTHFLKHARTHTHSLSVNRTHLHTSSLH